MKTTTCDKIAFACLIAAAALTLTSCVYSLAAQLRAAHLIQTVYSQPTPESRVYVAQSDRDETIDAPTACLARGQ